LPWALVAVLGCGEGETTEVMPASSTGGSSHGDPSSGDGSSSSGQADTSSTTEAVDPICGNGTVEGDEACDDMNIDALDGCLSNCTPGPNGIVRSPGAGLEYHGAGGGIRFDDACPAGEVMIGIRGEWQTVIERMQIVCGQIDVTETGDEWTFTVSEATVLPERGTSTGTPFMAMCPADNAVVGFSGRADQKLDAVGLSCAPLGVTSADDGPTLDVNLGNVTEVAIVGGGGGIDFGPLLCGPGEAVTMALIRTSDSINGLGLGCSKLDFG
jgi:cysteine-rich repeat protein